MFMKPINLLNRVSTITNPSYIYSNTMLTSIKFHQARSYHDPKSGHFEEEPPKTAYEQRLDKDKEKLRWRTPLNENTREWQSKFSLFAPKKTEDVDTIMWFQRPIDLSVSGWKKRREAKRVTLEIFMQQYIPERHQILGSDLAAAHFVVHRGGSVK